MLSAVYFSRSQIPSRSANAVHVMHMCDELAQINIDISLWCYASDEDKQNKNHLSLFDYYGINNKFEIKYYDKYKFPGHSFIESFKAVFQSYKLNIDYVLGRDPKSCYFSSILGVSVIFETHQPLYLYPFYERYMIKKMLKSKSFKGLVVISKKLKKIIQNEVELDEEKIYVLHDAAKDFGIQNKSYDTDKINVAYVGHLYQGRGIDIIYKLAMQLPELNFHVIGGEKKDIKFWQRKSTSNFIIHGYFPPAEVFRLRNKMDILLAPYQKKVYVPGGSDTSEWMSPLKIFEYMSSGKAIIASDIPVLREVLKSNINCLLVDPDDINQWLNALRKLIDNQDYRNKLGINARKDFEKNHTWTIRANKIGNILNCIIYPI